MPFYPFHPDPEQGMLEEDLYWLDYWNEGPDWFFIPREKSKYNVQRIKLIERIEEMDDTYVPPEKPT